jgi:hypothetical protein
MATEVIIWLAVSTMAGVALGGISAIVRFAFAQRKRNMLEFPSGR